ncbi:MAG: J domain-containing protein [Bacteroidota bacterium]
MAASKDPFRILSLPYDAEDADVRKAFRQRARETHPDRGGSPEAFLEVRAAYGALIDNREAERLRWQPEPAPPGPEPPPQIDRAIYPTCTVRISRTRDGRRHIEHDLGSRPARWTPGTAPPPGGTCVEQHASGNGTTGFGIWHIPVGPSQFRSVFGPLPAGAG